MTKNSNSTNVGITTYHYSSGSLTKMSGVWSMNYTTGYIVQYTIETSGYVIMKKRKRTTVLTPSGEVRKI